MTETAPASSPPPPAVSSGRWRRTLARAAWFGLMPVMATVATMRWLVPGRADVGPGLWGALAEQAARYPLLVAALLLLLFAGLARAWRDRLPFARLLDAGPGVLPAPQTLPRKITSVALAAVMLLGALVLRDRLVLLCEVAGSSMQPNFLPEDTLVVSKLAGHAPRRGDVIAFRTGPDQRETDAPGEVPDRLIKRVIGLPGDRVETKSGVPIINGWRVPHCDAGTYVRYATSGTVAGRLIVEFLEDKTYLSLHMAGTKDFAGYTVPPGEVFVLGDDRFNSDDSRDWRNGSGAGVSLAAIEGKPWRVIGADANGRVDLHRFLQRPGLKVDLAGVDVGTLESGIERCLKTRPAQTWPPPPRAG
jgi:signal peptidase I